MDGNQAGVLIGEGGSMAAESPAQLGKQMSVFIDSYLDLNTHHEMPLLGQWGGVLDHAGIRSLAN